MRKYRHHNNPQYKEDRIVKFKNESAEDKGLLLFLEEKLPERSRTDVKSFLKNGRVKIGEEIVTRFDYPVVPGGEVAVNLSRAFIKLRHPRVELVYEDDDVIVVNKGYGLLSVDTPSKRKEETAYGIVREYLKKKNPSDKLYVVHRLDRDTSGLMMFAKNEESQEILRHNWNNFVLERLYVALLEGYVENDSGFVKSHLAENSQYKVFSVNNPDAGKLALTRYKVLSRGHGLSLVEFSLDTGRKNQIRVHASDMGHPIAGDRKYGGHTSSLNRLCLHARTLRFAHPVTKKDMNFELPLPPRFFKAVGGLRKGNN